MFDFDQYAYWGKASGEQCHLLPYHCLDVAAVAAQWWARSPPLRRHCCHETRAEEATTRAWVLFFTALHDLGKFDIRFQLKAIAALIALRPTFDLTRADPEPGFNHGQAAVYWFKRDMAPRGFGTTHWDHWLPWVMAVAGHHGGLNTQALARIGLPEAEEEIIAADREVRFHWLSSLADLFLTPVGLALDDLPPSCPQLLAGFCAVSDWLGSNSDYFPYRADAMPLADYWAHVQSQAAHALGEAGLCQPPLPTGGMRHTFPELESRQVQCLVEQLPITPGMTLIEAPTGSGKTEAALGYASRLLAAGQADAVIFALPTQASANAMFQRLERIAPRLFPGGANLLLAHGKAAFNRNFQALKTAQRPTAQGREEALAQCVAWLGASRKRAFLGQIGVCTIDQVLLSVLPVRHQFVRAFGLRKAVLIVDEVHAYDAYMYGLLFRVLEGQSRAGGSAVLLSATLPAYQKAALCQAWRPDATFPPVTTYPLVTSLTADGMAQPYVLPPDQSPAQRDLALDCWHTHDLLPDQEQCQALLAAARAGALVGIVCNLVTDAQRLANQLKALAQDVPVDLFHARYRFADRLAREEAILTRYGKDAPRSAGRVLVATQVIEQSLDLDFDWLITQLCPVDLLFQRVGRLHRHARPRPPGFNKPRCTVIRPLNGPCELPDYGLHGVVYGFRRVLWRTEHFLDRAATIAFPGAYREWLEPVYQEAPWPDEPSAITQDAERFLQDQQGRYYAARQLAVSTGEPLPDTDAHAALLTRDGEMSLAVVLLCQAPTPTLLDGRELTVLGPWEQDEALDLNTVHVPQSWRCFLPAADADSRHWLTLQAADEAGWTCREGEALFHYDAYAGLSLTAAT